jgi:hypothetical protein
MGWDPWFWMAGEFSRYVSSSVGGDGSLSFIFLMQKLGSSFVNFQ